jgi:hypothetical protein
VGSGFYISIYQINRKAELLVQLITILSISLKSHCVNSSPPDLLYSSVLLVPIRCLVCVLLAASIIHSSLN